MFLVYVVVKKKESREELEPSFNGTLSEHSENYAQVHIPAL